MAEPIPLPLRGHAPHASSLASLERLPGWWLGAAETRRAFARDALNQRLDKIADEHLRAASEYERRARALIA